jgi:hypothetical protein
MGSSPMPDGLDNCQDTQRQAEQIRELQAQISLLRRTNQCLCQENADLKRGREALLSRLTLLEAGLSQHTQAEPDGSASHAAETGQEMFPETDRWLLSTSRANYATLKDLLAQQDWEAADRETQRLMLQIAGPEAQAQGFLDAMQIDEFPCLDLKILNKLWIIYSNGKYGFMIQRELWVRTHSTRNLWHNPDFDGYYPRREGLGTSLAKRLLRCALDDF